MINLNFGEFLRGMTDTLCNTKVANVKEPVTSDVNLKEFEQGLKDKLAEADYPEILDTLVRGGDSALTNLKTTIMSTGNDSKNAILAGLLMGGTYDIGRRALYNTKAENKEESILGRTPRYVVPTAAVATTGKLLSAAFPDYYNYPEFYQ